MSIGTYPALVNSTSAGAKTEIKALLTTLQTMVTSPATPGGTAMQSPELDRIPPAVSTALVAELVAIAAAITNGA